MGHYLEAYDSVRSGWQLSHSARSETHLQAWTETLIALAFGETVVVPASYAVDSHAFQQVLLEVQAAYKLSHERDPRFWMGRPRPVMLHLHRARSFGAAAADLFERIGRAPDDPSVPPFHSSLFPDFKERTGVDDRIPDQLRTTGVSRALADAFGDDERGELFTSACEWFSGATAQTSLRVVRPRPLAHRTLQSHAEALVRIDPRVVHSLPDESAETVERIVSALRRLQGVATVDAPFNDRSRLRGDWAWSAGGRSAREVIGEQDLALVREVIDTLYNRVIVSSIGTATASFSTAFGSPGALMDALEAQGLALIGGPDDEGPDTAPDEDSPDTTARTMELSIGSDPAVARRVTAGLGEGSAVETLLKVLEAPKDPLWRESLDAIDKARHSGEPESMHRAVSDHSKLLSELLGPTWRADTDRHGRIDIRLLRSPGAAAAAGAGGAVAGGAVEILASTHPALLLAYSGLSAATSVLGASWLQRRAVRKPQDILRGAVSEIVQVREVLR